MIGDYDDELRGDYADLRSFRVLGWVLVCCGMAVIAGAAAIWL